MSIISQNINSDFINFLSFSTSPYHTIQTCISKLEESGFSQLIFSQSWDLKPGNSYYTIPYGTTLFAFHIGNELEENSARFRMIASHTDHPGFRLKPNPSIFDKGHIKLNAEVYGGAILNTWLDRPLSIAGKIVTKSENIFSPTIKLFDYKRPLLTIPNLAIHMNKNVNSGVELNKQQELLPLFSFDEMQSNKDPFLGFLSQELNIAYDDILDYDLSIYNSEKGCTFGRNGEFISAPRIDNLSSVYASLEGICNSKKASSCISIAAFYDNEEIGSSTKQGADSYLSQIFFEKIFDGLSYSKNALNNSILKSFLLSMDVAHGYHPNYNSKSDPTNIVTLGHGVALKLNSNQRYATDSEAIGAIMQLCNQANIPIQKYVNRSDMAGGSTLGSILSAHLPMRTVDLGIPILAMHSARETAAVNDLCALKALCQSFYSC